MSSEVNSDHQKETSFPWIQDCHQNISKMEEHLCDPMEGIKHMDISALKLRYFSLFYTKKTEIIQSSVKRTHARHGIERALSSVGVDINFQLQHYGGCSSYSWCRYDQSDCSPHFLLKSQCKKECKKLSSQKDKQMEHFS